jgi:hypothetical protein
MSYSLMRKTENGYLHFTVTGENSPETVAGYMAEIRAEYARSGLPGILIEESLSGPGLGIADIFSLVARGASESWPGLRAMAFVDGNPEHDPSRMRFAENVAVNRGVNIRVFADVAGARTWLARAVGAPE